MNGLMVLLVLSASVFAVRCIWVKEMENKGYYQGDIVLDPDEHMPGWGDNSSSTYASIKGSRWPNGEIPYVITDSIGPTGVQAINEAIKNYQKYTCLRFVRRSNQREYISFYRGSGCSSQVGWRSGRINHISLAEGCWRTGIVMHEIGHSMGFWHEQMRPDRDRYVRILWGNIQEGLDSQFKKCDSRIIDSLGTAYDFRSMMHYGAYAFAASSGRMTIQTINPNNQHLIGQRDGFSDIDIKQLQLMYCQECEDLDKSCEGWAKLGECTKNPAWMEKNCCESCESVGGGGSCIDRNPSCGGWAKIGECEKNPGYMKVDCCKSCQGR